jgi:plasmid segregation protein ParM
VYVNVSSNPLWSLSAALENHVAQYIKELLNALRERGIDLQLPTVFAGGGAELLGDALSSSDVFTVGTLDRFANAEGYKFLLG